MAGLAPHAVVFCKFGVSSRERPTNPIPVQFLDKRVNINAITVAMRPVKIEVENEFIQRTVLKLLCLANQLRT